MKVAAGTTKKSISYCEPRSLNIGLGYTSVACRRAGARRHLRLSADSNAIPDEAAQELPAADGVAPGEWGERL